SAPLYLGSDSRSHGSAVSADPSHLTASSYPRAHPPRPRPLYPRPGAARLLGSKHPRFGPERLRPPWSLRPRLRPRDPDPRDPASHVAAAARPLAVRPRDRDVPRVQRLLRVLRVVVRARRWSCRGRLPGYTRRRVGHAVGHVLSPARCDLGTAAACAHPRSQPGEPSH